MDRGLVEQARRGDHDAFEHLAGAAAPGLDVIARLITRDPDRAKDAVQETLVRAWRDLPTLRDPDRFDAWLRRLLVHSCMDVLRRVRRWSIEVELTDVHHADDGDVATVVADRDAIERAFRGLDGDLRAIVVLHYYLGLTLPDVADALGVPLGTAKSRLHRALRELRVAIAPPALGRVNAAGGTIR
jgi:RNA polymerase sigma-70 factor (ECF subfamily)